MITELALSFPAGSRFAIASRDTVSLPAARLRAHGGIVEIGADDLAMSDREAAALLGGAGVDAGAHDVDGLVRRTEGWPAGLYLAALAMRAGSPAPKPGSRSPVTTGSSATTFVRSSWTGCRTTDVAFLTRTSILDRMCGGLCDAVVGRTGSSRTLEQLESRNLLVVPLDRRREWYRYHHLFRELLHAELSAARTGARCPAACRSGAVVRGELHAGAGHRARHGRGRRGAGRPPRAERDAAGVGQWPDRHGAQLDGVARGPK